MYKRKSSTFHPFLLAHLVRALLTKTIGIKIIKKAEQNKKRVFKKFK